MPEIFEPVIAGRVFFLNALKFINICVSQIQYAASSYPVPKTLSPLYLCY